MDFTLQKAVELGVNKITPIISERCNVKMDADRWEKRLNRWRQIIISACEQSGRQVIPTLNPVVSLDSWVASCSAELKLILHPHEDNSLNTNKKHKNIILLIGPEGGFSQMEIGLALKNDFRCVQLGPRILRTETAALAGVAVLQSMFGDFGTN